MPFILVCLDFVHCVRVPLTGTTVAEFWACGSLVGIGLCTVTYSRVQYCRLLRAPLTLYCNGPTSWQWSQAYMFDPVSVHVIISFGDCSVSRFCPKYWVVPHRLARAQQVVSEPGDWRLPMGSLPGEGITGRRSKMPILRKICSAMNAGPV